MNLHTLYINFEPNLERLPVTLTQLTVTHPSTSDLRDYRHLLSLTSITLNQDEFWHCKQILLPQSLQVLTLMLTANNNLRFETTRTLRNFANLPVGLREFSQSGGCHFDVNVDAIAMLPRGLQTLDMMMRTSTNMDEVISALPPTLRVLKLTLLAPITADGYARPPAFALLPPTLQTFIMIFGNARYDLAHFTVTPPPPVFQSLRRLRISVSENNAINNTQLLKWIPNLEDVGTQVRKDIVN